MKKIYGNGAHARHRNANSDVAHWKPNLLYIWTPKSGNAAAKADRAKLLAARALAAYSGYDSTRKVKMPA